MARVVNSPAVGREDLVYVLGPDNDVAFESGESAFKEVETSAKVVESEEFVGAVAGVVPCDLNRPTNTLDAEPGMHHDHEQTRGS
ncbi:MAG: hypothetical protein ACRC0L_08540 [Angustibacter sp.]